MTLFKKVKACLPDVGAAISDPEFILLNRKDFQYSQVSTTHALLLALGSKCGYPYRVLLNLLEQFAAAIDKRHFTICLADPSLTLAALLVWIKAGGSSERGRVLAPFGISKLPITEGILAEIIDDFRNSAATTPRDVNGSELMQGFVFVIGNSKTSEQTLFAVDRYLECASGLLVLKDYARLGAADEREYLEERRVFPAITFEGHALCLKL